MQAPSPSALGLIALLALISWRAYARFRRLVGRQRLSRRRPWITLTVFPLLVLVLGYGARGEPQMLASLLAGLALGAMLAAYGLSKTRFEATPQGLYYTPDAPVGLVVSLGFAARVAYRVVEILVQPSTPRDAASFARSPLTLAVFGLLAGYFIAYAIGLLRWRRSVVD
ncbi:MAG TPA: hypothetical protein VFF44_13730 [Casimicrobiaceae bacterium]|nr:hypothetical protein [Casimicrobiaceae bacterium]